MHLAAHANRSCPPEHPLTHSHNTKAKSSVLWLIVRHSTGESRRGPDLTAMTQQRGGPPAQEEEMQRIHTAPLKSRSKSKWQKKSILEVTSWNFNYLKTAKTFHLLPRGLQETLTLGKAENLGKYLLEKLCFQLFCHYLPHLYAVYAIEQTWKIYKMQLTTQGQFQVSRQTEGMILNCFHWRPKLLECQREAGQLPKSCAPACLGCCEKFRSSL